MQSRARPPKTVTACAAAGASLRGEPGLPTNIRSRITFVWIEVERLLRRGWAARCVGRPASHYDSMSWHTFQRKQEHSRMGAHCTAKARQSGERTPLEGACSATKPLR